MNLIFVWLFVSSAFAAPDSIPVPKPFLQCKVDHDCETTVKLCGCCGLTAMNKKFIAKYVELERYCEQPRPMCKCAASTAKPKCVKHLCELK